MIDCASISREIEHVVDEGKTSLAGSFVQPCPKSLISKLLVKDMVAWSLIAAPFLKLVRWKLRRSWSLSFHTLQSLFANEFEQHGAMDVERGTSRLLLRHFQWYDYFLQDLLIRLF